MNIKKIIVSLGLVTCMVGSVTCAEDTQADWLKEYAAHQDHHAMIFSIKEMTTFFAQYAVLGASLMAASRGIYLGLNQMPTPCEAYNVLCGDFVPTRAMVTEIIAVFGGTTAFAQWVGGLSTKGSLVYAAAVTAGAGVVAGVIHGCQSLANTVAPIA